VSELRISQPMLLFLSKLTLFVRNGRMSCVVLVVVWEKRERGASRACTPSIILKCFKMCSGKSSCPVNTEVILQKKCHAGNDHQGLCDAEMKISSMLYHVSASHTPETINLNESET